MPNLKSFSPAITKYVSSRSFLLQQHLNLPTVNVLCPAFSRPEISVWSKPYVDSLGFAIIPGPDQQPIEPALLSEVG